MARPQKLPRLLLVGAGGQLGWDCLKVMASDYEVLPLTSKDLDLRKSREIVPLVQRLQPQVIINAAAHTGVDACENEIDEAMLLNAEAPAQLARAADSLGARLIQISTDYVFAGDRPGKSGYREDDAVGPVSVYGRSKLAGEQAVAAAQGEHLIVRTAWLYGFGGHNFLKTMLRLALGGGEIRVVADQLGCLTWSRTLACQLLKLLQAGKKGLYHAVAEDHGSWYDAAALFLELMQVPHKLCPCASIDYPTAAKRPANSILINQRLHDEGLQVMKSWRQDLTEFVRLYREKLLQG